MSLRRAQILCLVGLAASSIYTFATMPLTPALVGTHPVLLEVLRGSISSMITAGAFARVGHTSLMLALLAPLPAVMMADPLLWWAGRIWGPKILAMMGGEGPRAQRRIARAGRWVERYGSWAVLMAYLLPVPNGLIYAGVGWRGMSLRRFLLLDMVGASIWVMLNVGLGYEIGRSAVDVAQAIGHYGLILSIALIPLMLIISVRRRRQFAFDGFIGS
jgi:membrane-associated protein